MIKIVNTTLKYNKDKIKRDIDHYIEYITNGKIIKGNLFYTKKVENIYEGILSLLDIYNHVSYKGGIYFLTKNMELINYIYKEILILYSQGLKLPDLLVKILKENIKNYEENGKINVFKDVLVLELLFVKEGLFDSDTYNEKINLFNNVKKRIDNDYLLNIDFLLKKDNSILERLVSLNVTTIYNRKKYDYDEAIKRIKKDFQKEMIEYMAENSINIGNKPLENKEIVKFIKNFSILFGNKILKKYITDFIYYSHFYAGYSIIEVITEINNNLLFKIENSFIEDYNIIADDNIELYNFIQNKLIIMFKYGVIGNFEEELYIIYKENNGKELNDFFQYRIYY